MQAIYLDHAATTPIAPEVFETLKSLLVENPVGNSSSSHQDGVRAAALLAQARESVAAKLGVSASEIVFTSGGTEGNNWILQRVIGDAARVMAAKGKKPHLLTSAIEHSSIVNVAQWLKDSGISEWSELPVESDGRVNMETLKAAIRPNTVLVSIAHGNNEIGTIQDLRAIGTVCRERGVLFHSDACQTFCHEDFKIGTEPVDFMSLSGHKVRAPKGIGAVFIRRGLEISPLLFGGKQERGLRPGTTSVELICAFAKATEVWSSETVNGLHTIRRYAIERLQGLGSGVRINGPTESPALCHVLSFTMANIHSKVLHRELTLAGISCSTGAACGTGKSDSSAVLLGLGRAAEDAHQIRLSFSPTTDRETIDVFIDRLGKVLKAHATK